MAQPGDRISEYVLDSPAGSGTFGTVWRARHHVWTQQLVAIKLPTSPAYLRELQREGLAASRLSHPNVVKAIGFDPYADPPYLVMEYVAGRSLRELLRNGPLATATAVTILRQILSGLAHAHENGIVHRDLKPENVLLTEAGLTSDFAAPGSVKITDFGLGQTQAKGGSIAYSLSIAGDAQKLVGTLDYMSPEQRAGGDVDARSDLYACGAMLFEMITGEKPTGTEVPSDLRSGVPEGIDHAFRRAYTRLDRRIGSAAELQLLLADRTTAVPLPVPASSATAAGPSNLPARASRNVCPRCERPVAPGDQFCMHCGVQLVTLVRRCNRCGSYPDPTDDFCTQCGHGIAKMRLAN
jgi:serine/threonine-protein kinase